MISVAIDTSVLLSIFKDEEDGAAWLECLRKQAESAALWVSPVVLAEVRSFFPDDESCLEALSSLRIRPSAWEEKSSLMAGGISRDYRRAGGPRTTILPDFLVAAHAARQMDALATTDRGYLRSYFPDLKILSLRGAV